MPLKITAVKKKTKNRTRRVAAPRKWNWEVLRLEWLARNTDPTRTQAYTVNQLAEDFEIPAPTVLAYAKNKGWVEDLDQLQGKLAHMRELTLVMKGARDLEAIRDKQAKFANLAMDKAISKLALVNPAELTVKEATELLRLGLNEERKALGIAENAAPPSPLPLEAATEAEKILKSFQQRRKQTLEAETILIEEKHG